MTRWLMLSDLQFGQSTPTLTNNDELAERLIKQASLEHPAFVVNCGDSIHGEVEDSAKEARNVKRLWAKYHLAIRPLTDFCPVITIMGNHDQTGSAATTENFCRETGREGQKTYFSKTIGDIHVVALNTSQNRNLGGFLEGTPQARWLRRDLKRTRNAKCTIVCGHYPIFVQTHCYDDSDPSLHYDELAREEGVLLPMLLDGNVDVYLCGHQHIYQRLRYGRLTQIMAGGLNSPYERWVKKQRCRFSQVYDPRQSYIRFTVTDKSIRGEAIALGGDIIDTWTKRLNKNQSR